MASQVVWKRLGSSMRSASPWPVILLLFIASWSIHQSSDPTPVQAADELLELLQRAESLFREERPELAVPLLRKVIEEARDVVVPVAELKSAPEAKPST
ncbi:MAG: hypothetical protein ACKOUR_09300, partial [Planctomycetota bacterium]